MTKSYRLTPRAFDALQDIANWTVQEFGAGQADRYVSLILGQCEAICDRTAHVRDASAFANEPSAETLLITRAGQHYIVFENASDEFVITDFIHVRSDLPRRLQSSRPKNN